MTLLETIHGPADIKHLDAGQLTELADEIRHFLIDKVLRTGGHLGPNPKGPVGPDIPAVDQHDGIDVLHRSPGDDVLLVSVGAMAATACEAARRLTEEGLGVTVVDPAWLKPVDPSLIKLAEQYRLVVTVEDNLRVGGYGSLLAQELRDAGVPAPVSGFGIPQRFLDHGERADILAECGLSPEDLARSIRMRIAADRAPGVRRLEEDFR
ncbi:transketolase C-terminal domain-containing protein [Streptomyces sp. OE57]|uniref:transketolase C-terminal domain-containing protein n=1 Tax=Streptomyces lacaronensis TaxID=3379885 RepID=UPI0039B72F98